MNDIEHVESNSYNGVGIIKIFLQPGANVDGGVTQVSAIAQTVTRLIPPGQAPRLIIRYNAATRPHSPIQPDEQGECASFKTEGTMVGVVSPDNRVALRNVTIGCDFGQTVEVLHGVTIADRAVMHLPDSLVEGSEVRSRCSLTWRDRHRFLRLRPCADAS